MLSSGAPQGCVLSSLLSLLTHDCVSTYSTNHLVRFVDDTTVVALINNNEKTNYRGEVNQLVQWCKVNSLFLNLGKSKEMVIDFRRRPP